MARPDHLFEINSALKAGYEHGASRPRKSRTFSPALPVRKGSLEEHDDKENRQNANNGARPCVWPKGVLQVSASLPATRSSVEALATSAPQPRRRNGIAAFVRRWKPGRRMAAALVIALVLAAAASLLGAVGDILLHTTDDLPWVREQLTSILRGSELAIAHVTTLWLLKKILTGVWRWSCR
eukprot:gnl/TRDRNA2_/TRDRNA2_35333_c0_seq1.p1 gnl/TRDRNA2_/TRDRNA2_35333_c0~~gnl/TRDRNA2_/TRDRNA2_35333_c0_seq1.p1  ORF type:complete len:182 (+),score=16.05 gnl/TRDRNA2_/TRDRNA2_35333_c0_seq1:56-601(+)